LVLAGALVLLLALEESSAAGLSLEGEQPVKANVRAVKPRY